MIRRGLANVYYVAAALVMVGVGIVLFIAIFVPLLYVLLSPFIPRA